MMDAPSTACCLCQGLDAATLEASFDSLLRDRGYVRRDAEPPAGLPLVQDEWLGLGFDPGLVRPECVDAVFRLARWWSAAQPELAIAAVRRYRLMDPVLKLYLGGTPRYRDGADPDHEVAYAVPTSLPADLELPSGLPARVAEVPQTALRGSWREAARLAGWVRHDSAWAP